MTPLAHPPQNVLAWALINAGLGTDPAPWAGTTAGDDWPVFYGVEPDRPDNAVTVYEGTPQLDGRTGPDGAVVQHYGFTVRVRGGPSKAAVRLKAETIFRYLNETLYDLKLTLDGQEYSVPSAYARRIISLGLQQFGSNQLWLYNVDVIAPLLAYPTGR